MTHHDHSGHTFVYLQTPACPHSLAANAGTGCFKNTASADLFCCREGWRIILVGSRFTHAAESRYAPIAGEALAVADALDKARHFVLGCKNLTIIRYLRSLETGRST